MKGKNSEKCVQHPENNPLEETTVYLLPDI